ncbi:MAG: Ig-like domain-containing protein [Alphaproteobacteria bacterium]|nr:Ig-like domain-containing protein [Alphaproteobacteria bacterium]
MRRLSTFTLAALLSGGCATKDSVSLDDTAVDDTGPVEGDADADTDTDTDTDLPCEAEILSIDPVDGQADVPVDAAVQVTLSEAVNVNQYTFVLEGPSGDVAGQAALGGDGDVITFTPEERLERQTEYTAAVEVCDAQAEASFVTVSPPLGDRLEGRTYDVDLNDVQWNDPPNGEFLVSFLETQHLLFMVEDVDTNQETIDFVGAVGLSEPTRQDPCTEAFDFDPADFSNDPAFRVGPEDTTFEASGESIEVYELTAFGSFANDGEILRNFGVTGYLDLRDFEYNGVAACAVAPIILSASCVACPNDGTEGCLRLDVESPEAPYLANVTLDPDVDPSSDPNCR